MRSALPKSLPVLVASLLGLAAAAPSALAVGSTAIANKAPSAMAGFAIVQFDGSMLNHAYNYDSAGGTVSSSEGITGVYQVTFGHLGFAGGDVQVTAIDFMHVCTAASWAPDSMGNLVVSVECYSVAGSLSGSEFQVLITQPQSRPNGVLDYDWVYKARGKLTNRWQYNSSGKVNSVRHPAKGVYVVSMPGPGLKGASTGTVKVTPYGAGGGNCQITAWRTIKTGEQITVGCFAPGGAPANREFDVVYARGTNLMGLNGKTTVSAYASGNATLYQPKVQFDSVRRARTTIVHVDRGSYLAILVGSHPTGHFSGGFGNAETSPVGSALRYCVVFPNASHTPLVEVGCYDKNGHPADTAFTVQWVVT
jgi:hypothetical protein